MAEDALLPRREEARAPSAPEARSGAEPLEQTYTVEVSGKRFDVRVVGPPLAFAAGSNGAVAAPAGPPASGKSSRRASAKAASGPGGDTLASPLQGNMWKVLVKQGDTVEEGQLLCIIEAMKMENEITAHKAGRISELPIVEGAAIQAGAPIATIVSAAESEG